MKQQWLRQMFLLAIYEGVHGAGRLIDELREETGILLVWGDDRRRSCTRLAVGGGLGKEKDGRWEGGREERVRRRRQGGG